MEENEINNYSNSQSENNLISNVNNYGQIDENEEIEEIEELNEKDKFNLFFESLVDLFSKKQYKKIFYSFFSKDEKDKKEKEEGEEEKEEEEESEEYNINLSEWKLQFLEATCIQKIIEKKIKKYYKMPRVPHLNNYIKRENHIINKWLLLINEINKENNEDNDNDKLKCFYEFIIKFILQKCVNLSKRCIYKKKIKDALSFLSLGVKLINFTCKYFNSPETASLCGEIFLFLSSILIADNNYETAKNFINLSLIFFYTSLESILFINPKQISYSMFNIFNQKTVIYDLASKIIFYFSILFYNLGICYENQGFPYDSFHAYKQSKFFTSLLKDKNIDIEKLYEYINEIDNRQLMRNRIIIFFERCVSKEELIDKEIPKKKVYNLYNIMKERKEKRYLKIENYISNMKLLDVDNDEPNLFNKINRKFNYKVNLITKKIHLLDYLMNDKFNDIINDMKIIRINKLDNKTIDVFQKGIINIKNEERDKLARKLKKKQKEKEKEIQDNKISQKIRNDREQINCKTINTNSSAKTFISGKKTRVSSAVRNSQGLMTDINYSAKSESFFSFNSRPNTAKNELGFLSRRNIKGNNSVQNIYKRNQILAYEKNKSDKNIFNKRNKIFLSTSPKEIKMSKIKYNIPKYYYNKFIFGKSFRKKRNILEKEYSKELKFQKDILQCKHYEIIKPESININEVKKSCEKFYFSTFEKELMNAKESLIFFDKKDIDTNTKIKDKKINNFFLSQKTKEIIYNNDLNENKKKNELQNPNKINNEYIDKLFGDIVYLNEQELKIKKKYGNK